MVTPHETDSKHGKGTCSPNSPDRDPVFGSLSLQKADPIRGSLCMHSDVSVYLPLIHLSLDTPHYHSFQGFTSRPFGAAETISSSADYCRSPIAPCFVPISILAQAYSTDSQPLTRLPFAIL